ncbi:hypothetical protein PoB_004644400 [Plakobranchus ocellatus]|uniref:Uncharacterized protein n=1 Tax=Plakobranchus ocellatus TaxID=259542 RepID=A0AAV4BIL2_9GAST|nr:hypothetical protein PoB_004644400 [Plakobranchus ocellatus]
MYAVANPDQVYLEALTFPDDLSASKELLVRVSSNQLTHAMCFDALVRLLRRKRDVKDAKSASEKSAVTSCELSQDIDQCSGFRSKDCRPTKPDMGYDALSEGSATITERSSLLKQPPKLSSLVGDKRGSFHSSYGGDVSVSIDTGIAATDPRKKETSSTAKSHLERLAVKEDTRREDGVRGKAASLLRLFLLFLCSIFCSLKCPI